MRITAVSPWAQFMTSPKGTNRPAQATKLSMMDAKMAKPRITKSRLLKAHPTKNMSGRRGAREKSTFQKYFGKLTRPDQVTEGGRVTRMFKTADGQSFPVSMPAPSKSARVTKMIQTAAGESFPVTFPA